MSGVYNVVITNTVNGCTSTNSILVTDGSLDVSMSPDPVSGYAPLPVTFNNTTPYTSSSGTITTFWSYGNGIVTTNTALASSYSSVTPYPYNSGSAIYQSAGSYTVLLMVSQTVGTVSCVGTATAVVNVELPSDLTVPNVFTPNGDGVNDNFTLLTTNIKDIKCTIFDRWGVKVYDVTSDKGNISWDGKNFGGKEMPAGTYFYILTAEGKDAKTEWTDNEGKKIKMNGTISLFR
jgi:gliding motility-associated-like protein